MLADETVLVSWTAVYTVLLVQPPPLPFRLVLLFGSLRVGSHTGGSIYDGESCLCKEVWSPGSYSWEYFGLGPGWNSLLGNPKTK